LSLVIAERGPHLPFLNARAHLRWTWELEWCEDFLYLVPLPGRCYLAAQEPQFPPLNSWLQTRLAENQEIKGIDLNTGKHRTLTLQGKLWGAKHKEKWEPLDGEDWRVRLDMRALAKLGYSVDAFYYAGM
jgi:hypothetical protein